MLFLFLFSLFQFEIYFYISLALRTAMRCVPVRDAFQARTESKCSACFDANWQLKARWNDMGMEHATALTVAVVVGAASAALLRLLCCSSAAAAWGCAAVAGKQIRFISALLLWRQIFNVKSVRERR